MSEGRSKLLLERDLIPLQTCVSSQGIRVNLREAGDLCLFGAFWCPPEYLRPKVSLTWEKDRKTKIICGFAHQKLEQIQGELEYFHRLAGRASIRSMCHLGR